MGVKKLDGEKIYIIIPVLAIFLLLCFGSITVKAEENSQITTDGLEIQCDYYENEAVITKYEGSETVINIPEEFDGCEVTGIQAYAFYNSQTIETVNIPKTITQIGEGAFSNCVNLKNVNISSECNIEKIESETFKGCENLSELNLPESGLEIIGAAAFSGCSNLASFLFGEDIKEIEFAAFSGCSSLKNITLNEGVQLIDNFAFSQCISISSITFPSSLEKIGTGAFVECTKLESATNVPSLFDEVFSGCSLLKVVKFQNGAEYIGESAFANTAIETIVIPNSVKEIYAEAFSECSNLEKVYILSKNITIAYSAFTKNSKIALFGFSESGTEKCAKTNGLSFTPIEEVELTCKENKKHEVNLSWNSVENASQYDVYRSDKKNGEYVLLESVGTNILRYTDTSVDRGKKYFYYVSAQKTLEDGITIDIPSENVSVSIKKPTLKVSKEKVNIKYSTSIVLSFTEEGTAYYKIKNPNIVSVAWVGDFYGDEVRLKITGLKKGKTKIIFSNSENDDTVSVDVTVDKPIPQIAQVKGTSWKKKNLKNQEGDGVTYVFSWKKISGVTGYEVVIYEKEGGGWYPYTKETRKNSISVSFSSLTGLKAKVRAYKVVGEKIYYGKWSTIKKAKIRY